MKRFRFAVAAVAFSSFSLVPSTIFAADPLLVCSDSGATNTCSGSGSKAAGFPALAAYSTGLLAGSQLDNGYARIATIWGPPFRTWGSPVSFAGNSSVETLIGLAAFGGGGLSALDQFAFALMDSAEVWKFDGTTWTQITPTTPGFSNNSGVYGGAKYKNSLFIGTNNSSGAQVWSFDGAAWAKANIPGFSSNNVFVWVMTVYNNVLYMGTVNYTGSAELWKFDGTTWTKVSIPGFSANNYAIASMAIYNGALHIGTGNVSTGAELWKFNGTTWTKVNVPGLAANNSITSMAEYPGSGALFLGTTNYYGGAGQLWKFDGTSGTQVNIPGFSANNTGIVSMATYYNSLFFGTYNTSGAEIWYLPQMQPCAATLASDLSLHIPDVTFNNQTYWADFRYDPNTQSIIFVNVGVVADTSPFSSCTPATLSPSLALHLPVVMFQGISFRVDLRNSTGLNFTATGVGPN